MHCNICSAVLDGEQGTTVPLTEIKQIARNGFGPHKRGSSVTVPFVSLKGATLFMRETYVSAQERNEWWRQKVLADDRPWRQLIRSLSHIFGWRRNVVTDDKPWLLCRRCYGETRPFVSSEKVNEVDSMKYVYVFIIFVIIGYVVYATLVLLGSRLWLLGVGVYSFWAWIGVMSERPKENRSRLVGISVCMLLLLLVAGLNEGSRVQDTEGCIQQLGFTSAQCEQIVDRKFEDCKGFFEENSEQCTFFITRNVGVEECVRLFDYTDEQCHFFIRIKTPPSYTGGL